MCRLAEGKGASNYTDRNSENISPEASFTAFVLWLSFAFCDPCNSDYLSNPSQLGS